jgi:eukaryotic-like serine/threonine-protein kinase
MIGTRLAHYEINSHLGTGGMGEVYQATDAKLGRSVAIKLLPAAFAQDEERVGRFEREARVLASLNHPNIAAIYGVEESGARKFLVMELVDGETLAEKIKRGAIPIPEALGIAIQITEALEAAHEKGVIHRDLKPANIKVTPDGRVKVLDFGLAKAFAGDTEKTDLSNSPTMASMAATNAGMILGTAAYMSPEQAKGRTVGKRTDIFGFGCVLFEMLTGRAAFEGEDVADILSRVLQREPDWSLLPAAVPPRIRELLHLCLHKDMRKRRSDAADVRIDIEQALAAPLPTSDVLPVRNSRLAWAAFAVASLVAIAVSIPAFRHLREIPPPETRLDIVTPTTEDPMSFALSPDGRQLAYVASAGGVSQLWLRSLNSTTAQALAGTEGASYPFWSPNNHSIGFFANAKLKRLDIGGAPQTLATAVGRGGTWNAADVILFVPNPASGLFRIAASGGEAVPVTRLNGQNNHRFPVFLPNGRQFLFFALGAPEASGIYLGSLDSTEIHRITASETPGVYLPSGLLLWSRSGTLVGQQLDTEKYALHGGPAILSDQVAFESGVGVAVSVSAGGMVAYRAGGTTRRQLTWFDRSGKTLGVLGDPDDKGLSSPSLSPDGRRVAVYRTEQGNADIWVLDGTHTDRLTFGGSLNRYPLWSPDGSRIVFDSNRKGHRDLYQKSPDGGEETLLLTSDQDMNANDISMDGRFLLFYKTDPQTDRDIWVLPLEGKGTARVFLKTKFNERFAKFSPNGHWVTYMSNESGRMEIYVRPFVESAVSAAAGDASVSTGGQWQVSTNGGIFPKWSATGKEIYYIGSSGEMMAVPITATEKSVERGTPVALFPTRIVGGGVDNAQGIQYDVTRDGRFLINSVLEGTSVSPITLLQNWNPPGK